MFSCGRVKESVTHFSGSNLIELEATWEIVLDQLKVL
jgi:hypothetical protein